MNILNRICQEYDFDIYSILYNQVIINLYLELDRICNCACSFCRNQSFESVEYNFDKIVDNILKIIPFLKRIDIGGGEPTLRIEDLIRLKKIIGLTVKMKYLSKQYPLLDSMNEQHIIKNIHNFFGLLKEMYLARNIYNRALNRIDFRIFTNGSASLSDYKKLINNGYSLGISRHHYCQNVNQKIFGTAQSLLEGKECLELYLDKEEIVSHKADKYRYNHKIPYLNYREGNVLFIANLYRNGLQSIQDIVSYLKWVTELEDFEHTNKNMKVIFSNLHGKEILGSYCNIPKYDNLCIDERLMDEIEEWFHISENMRPIISSSGYLLKAYRFDIKESHSSINFYVRRYLDKETYEKIWRENSYYQKHIDLSMDPQGTIYTDYSQQKILIP